MTARVSAAARRAADALAAAKRPSGDDRWYFEVTVTCGECETREVTQMEDVRDPDAWREALIVTESLAHGHLVAVAARRVAVPIERPSMAEAAPRLSVSTHYGGSL